MTPEPNDSNNFDDAMDTRLLQLERELFSLTPTAPPRGLESRLDGRMCQPAGGERRIAAQVIPFRWSRIVVPAAAAVVVVSVLSRLESPRVPASTLTAQPGARQLGPTLPATQTIVEKTTGYLMKEEPFVVHPDSWEALQHLYWTESGSANHHSQPSLRRASLAVPLSFH